MTWGSDPGHDELVAMEVCQNWAGTCFTPCEACLRDAERKDGQPIRERRNRLVIEDIRRRLLELEDFRHRCRLLFWAAVIAAIIGYLNFGPGTF